MRWPFVDLRLGQCCRRWPNLKPADGQCLMFAGRETLGNSGWMDAFNRLTTLDKHLANIGLQRWINIQPTLD